MHKIHVGEGGWPLAKKSERPSTSLQASRFHLLHLRLKGAHVAFPWRPFPNEKPNPRITSYYGDAEPFAVGF